MVELSVHPRLFAAAKTKPSRTRVRLQAGPGWIPLLAMLAAAGCTSAPPELELDPGKTTEEGLQAVKNPRVQEAWLKPGVDFAVYRAIIIQPVEIAERPGGGDERFPRQSVSHFKLSDADRDVLAKEFSEIFAKELSTGDALALVSEPGPNVLRLRAALVDVVKKVRTGQQARRESVWANSAGRLTLNLEIMDAQTDELLARVVDRRELRSLGVGPTGVSRTSSVSRAADLQRVFQRWAKLLHVRFMALQAATEPAPTELE